MQVAGEFAGMVTRIRVLPFLHRQRKSHHSPPPLQVECPSEGTRTKHHEMNEVTGKGWGRGKSHRQAEWAGGRHTGWQVKQQSGGETGLVERHNGREIGGRRHPKREAV